MPIHYIDADEDTKGWGRPMLAEAIEILKNAHTPGDLRRAAKIVRDQGVKPVDIEKAITWWYENPETSAAYIWGPTPEGKPGAISDLYDIARARGEL
jgi:hypothetical protein